MPMGFTCFLAILSCFSYVKSTETYEAYFKFNHKHILVSQLNILNIQLWWPLHINDTSPHILTTMSTHPRHNNYPPPLQHHKAAQKGMFFFFCTLLLMFTISIHTGNMTTTTSTSTQINHHHAPHPSCQLIQDMMTTHCWN